MPKYYLMHKDDICGVISTVKGSGDIDGFSVVNPELTPFLGTMDDEKVHLWWKIRAVPASRKTMMEVIHRAGCYTSEEYLEKNLALSLTDAYWIRPINTGLSWKDVNLRNLLNSGYTEIPYHNATSYDPNAALSGQMEKYWDLSGETPILVKECDSFNGQQAINEVFAYTLHQQQAVDIAYTEYTAVQTVNGFNVKCPAFTTEDIELVSAYEVLKSQKINNDVSNYEGFIDICVQNGLDKDKMQAFMDYQTAMDFVISNTDRHLFNFGVLRDANTLKLIGPAPIFDNGNSMFFKDDRKYNRITILEREITSFHDKEERMLKHVKNRKIIDEDKLPSHETVKEIYSQKGISQEKTDIITHNYAIKRALFKDFQKGKTISLYNEKHRNDVER